MTRRRATWLVARRELIERGRSRAFVISLLFTLVFISAGIVVPTIIGGDERDTLGVVGTPPAGFETAIAAAADQYDARLDVKPLPDRAAGDAALRDDGIDILFVATPTGSGELVAKERVDERLRAIVTATVVTLRQAALLQEAGVSPADYAAASTPPTLTSLEPFDEARSTQFLFANAGVILLFISIFTFGYWVLTGVVEEKQSRVVEVVLATVHTRDLLVGKVLGIGILGLVQLVAMVVVGLGAALWTGRITLPSTTVGTLAMLLLWFVLGYALYSTAFAVLGALASRMEEASNASSPVTFVATGAYLFSLLVVLDDPSGLVARIGSLIPPVAPMVVPLRAALGAIEPWEVVLSAALTVAAIWGLFVFGSRVYSGAVLQGGSRMKLRDAWRGAIR
jgi:ABC-2 type transport system permease protein